MSQQNIFDGKIPLPDATLSAREKTLLGFDVRYQKIHDQLRLLLNLGELATWSKTHHRDRPLPARVSSAAQSDGVAGNG